MFPIHRVDSCSCAEALFDSFARLGRTEVHHVPAERFPEHVVSCIDV